MAGETEQVSDDKNEPSFGKKFLIALIPTMLLLVFPFYFPTIAPEIGLNAGWSPVVYATAMGLISIIVVTIFFSDIKKDKESNDCPDSLLIGVIIAVVSSGVGYLSLFAVDNSERVTASIVSYVDDNSKTVYCDQTKKIRIEVDKADLDKIVKPIIPTPK